MTYKDRTRPVIKLTSPETKAVFEALWQKSTRTKEKKLGQFDYPDFNGTVVQDLDWTSFKYSMTIYFNGDDHDTEAESFSQALNEKGPWTVVHPTKGTLILQVVSMTENNDVVENGSFTSFEMSFIEPASEEFIVSLPEAVSGIESLSADSNASLSGQFSSVKQDSFSKIQALKNQIDSVQMKIEKILGPIVKTVTEVNDQFNQISRSLQTALDDAVLTPLSIAGQVQKLTQLPRLVNNDFQERIERYSTLTEQILGISPMGNSPEDYNRISVQENVLGAVMVSAALIAADSDFQTRSQVIDAIEQLDGLFSGIVEHLDGLQTNFDGLDIDLQYFSQSQSYNDILVLRGAALKILLESIFSLAVEKRFTIDRYRHTLEITISEYGDLGENDKNYDLFISSNRLKNTEVEVLPPGKEVVVYVPTE